MIKAGKVFLLTLILAMILFLGTVGANGDAAPLGCHKEKTTVGGIIYQDNLENGISGATVTVTCKHVKNNEKIKETSFTITSSDDGVYAVLFNKNQCDYGDEVTVTAVKDGLTGENDGKVTMMFNLGCLTLNVGIVNVPMVPEFGIIAGSLTVVSAIAVFFLIRRK
jgi:hypothetical protein